MVVRDYLICDADFPTEGVWDGDRPLEPPGRELAEILRAMVAGRVADMTELWNEEDYGWSFNCDWDGVTMNVLVQRIDHWLIICQVVSLLPRFIRPRRYDAAFTALCYHLDRAIRVDARFRNLRWLTAQEYRRGGRP
jgi:hypothetical protein